MSDAAAELQARADLFNLTTTPERLVEISRTYPQFAAHIARHPNVDAELKAWAQQALAAEQAPQPAPSLTPPPAPATWAPEPLPEPDPYTATIAPEPWPTPYPYASSGVPVMMEPTTNAMAVLSLVFAFIFSPLGILFGHIAHSQIRQTGEVGSGLATAGLIISYISVGFWLLAGLFFLVFLGAALA